MSDPTPDRWKEIGMTPQEQEALSKHYALYCFVTPLSDGSFAVFANDRSRESMVIVDEFGLAIAITNRANRRGRSVGRLPDRPVDLSDLGV